MKISKNKISRILNFIKWENKLDQGDIVKIIRNESKYKNYDKYVEQYGKVIFIHYDKPDYPFDIKFLDGEHYCFKLSELCKVNEEEYLKKYSDLKELKI
jgi:hypothetical protein